MIRVNRFSKFKMTLIFQFNGTFVSPEYFNSIFIEFKSRTSSYFCSLTKDTVKNCKVVDQNLLVLFQDYNLDAGLLEANVSVTYVDTDFSNGYAKLTKNISLPVMLVDDETNESKLLINAVAYL